MFSSMELRHCQFMHRNNNGRSALFFPISWGHRTELGLNFGRNTTTELCTTTTQLPVSFFSVTHSSVAIASETVVPNMLAIPTIHMVADHSESRKAPLPRIKSLTTNRVLAWTFIEQPAELGAPGPTSLSEACVGMKVKTERKTKINVNKTHCES